MRSRPCVASEGRAVYAHAAPALRDRSVGEDEGECPLRGAVGAGRRLRLPLRGAVGAARRLRLPSSPQHSDGPRLADSPRCRPQLGEGGQPESDARHGPNGGSNSLSCIGCGCPDRAARETRSRGRRCRGSGAGERAESFEVGGGPLTDRRIAVVSLWGEPPPHTGNLRLISTRQLLPVPFTGGRMAAGARRASRAERLVHMRSRTSSMVERERTGTQFAVGQSVSRSVGQSTSPVSCLDIRTLRAG